jgi:hypothetical protein
MNGGNAPSGKEKEGDEDADHRMENRTKDEKTQGSPFPGGSIFHLGYICGCSAYQATGGKGGQEVTIHVVSPIAHVCLIHSIGYPSPSDIWDLRPGRH